MMQVPQPALLAEAVEALGSVAFPAVLLRSLTGWLPCDHLSIIVFNVDLSAHVVGAASRGPVNIAVEAGRLYERGRFYRLDPGTRQMRPDASGGPVLLRLRAADIQDPDYQRSIYGRFRLGERLSVIDRVTDHWLMLNLYCERDTARFTSQQGERLRTMAPLFLSLVGKHLTLTGARVSPARDSGTRSITFLESLLLSLDEQLTNRERAVCARALAGLTVAGIAADLGVKAPTIATLRQRAYSKLGISSLSQLFALCIEQLARRGR
jgi:DNA-binding CsgD family transcriptional regulator